MRLAAQFILATALVMPLSGCAALAPSGSLTPQQQYEEASLDFETVVTTLTTLRGAGKINDSTWNIILPLIQEGDRLLDSYEAALLAGEVDQAQLLRQSARRLAISLTVHLATQ